MLGRLSMTVDQALNAYEELADDVFGHPRSFHIRKPPWWKLDKYDHRLLEKMIKKIVKEHSQSGQANTSFEQPYKDMCRT